MFTCMWTRHVQYTRTDSGRQTLKVDPSTGSQVVTLLTEVNSATGSQVKDDGSYFRAVVTDRDDPISS